MALRLLRLVSNKLKSTHLCRWPPKSISDERHLNRSPMSDMNKHDQEYFIVLLDVDDPTRPFLKPDADSSSRRFLREGPPPGAPPMVFSNAHKKANLRRSIVAETSAILFSGFDLVVTTGIRDKLLDTKVCDLFMHPAVYVDDGDQRHENYWYLTFSNAFDCGDRAKSDYDKGSPIPVGGKIIYEVDSFRLDSNVLDSVPLEDRLVFKMGGVINASVFVHKSVRSIFAAGGKSGANIIQASEQ